SSAEQRLDPRPAMQRVLLACLPGLLVLLWLHGWGILLQLMLASVTCCLCEALSRRTLPASSQSLFGFAPLAEGSALVSAVLLALALPAYAPWWLTVSAA